MPPKTAAVPTRSAPTRPIAADSAHASTPEADGRPLALSADAGSHQVTAGIGKRGEYRE